MKLMILVWAVIVLLTSCAMPNLTPEERGEVEPIDQMDPFKSWPNQDWAKQALTVVRTQGLSELSPKDAKDFCPNGLTERNWVHLLGAMVKYESGFKPQTAYKECSKSKGTYGSSAKWFEKEKAYCLPGHALDGGVTVSRGLIQISIQSSNNYGCGFEDPQELHDTGKNLACAGKIMKRWVAADGVVAGGGTGAWRGGARYWSVLRSTRKLPEVLKTLRGNCE